MSRNLIFCCDRTGNEFGKTNTNVVRIVRSAATADGSQLVYYDPGIGTFSDSRVLTRAAQRASELVDLAFATGFEAKITGAYTFLMDSWEPGDHVYLFGFSRGAYTVRVVAAFLHLYRVVTSSQLEYGVVCDAHVFVTSFSCECRQR